MKNRIVILITGFFLLLLMGLIYAWSIFVAPLEAEFGWQRSQTSLIFTISMVFFCLGGLVSGILLKKKPSVFILISGGICLLAGFLGASRVQTLPAIMVCYGVFCGFGVGLNYNCVLSTVARWFPDRTGMCSGVLMMGFGFGSMVLGTAASAMISSIGWRSTFVTIGVVMAAVEVLCTFLIRLPEKADVAAYAAGAAGKKRIVEGGEYDFGGMVRLSAFWLYFIWALIFSAVGLAVIGHAAPMAREAAVADSFIATCVGLVSISGGLARILLGAGFDLFGRRKLMLVIDASYLLGFLALIPAIGSKNSALLIVGFLLIGFAYGGVPTMSSAYAASMFGLKNYPVNFSTINLAIIPAALVGPAIAGNLQVQSGSYSGAIPILIVLTVISAAAGFLIRAPKKGAAETAAPGTQA